MKNQLKLSFLGLLIILSGCCSEKLIDSYYLSDYDKALIPFDNFQKLSYLNENGQQINASTQPRIIKVNKQYRGAESCEYWETESLTNFINFTNNGFSIKLGISKFNNLTFFTLEYVIPNSDNSENEYFEDLIDPSIIQVVDINMNGFEFKNVYVFNNNYRNENSKIDTILYSAEGKGIELISFIDGKYLKLE